MKKKMIKCKSCGAEIAKTANRCPNCGARQHQVALSICAVIIVLTVVACLAIIGTSTKDGGQSNEEPTSSSGTTQQTDSPVICETGHTKASFNNAFEADGVTGCFYLSLNLENLWDKKVMYSMVDVVLDGTSVNTGSGIPITAQPEASVSGTFIIFTDAVFEDISSITFSISVRDAESLDELETSEPITIEF